MKSQRLFLMLALAVSVLLLFVACSEEKEDPTPKLISLNLVDVEDVELPFEANTDTEEPDEDYWRQNEIVDGGVSIGNRTFRFSDELQIWLTENGSLEPPPDDVLLALWRRAIPALYVSMSYSPDDSGETLFEKLKLDPAAHGHTPF